MTHASKTAKDDPDASAPGLDGTSTPPEPSIAAGTLWIAGGQAATLAVSFITTPFVLRQLGPQAYGVLSLVSLLIAYLSVTNLGMGQASTRFGAAAYGKGEGRGEVAVVWTALVVSQLASLVVAIGLVVWAPSIVELFRIPPHLAGAALFAFRLAAIGLFARTMESVVNTPQLVRLRLDVCAWITYGCGLAQIILVPVVLAAGGGLTGAVAVVVGGAVATALGHALASLRLMPELANVRFDGRLVPQLVSYGGAIALTSFCGLLTLDGEKLLLSRNASIEVLGYYSVAFTLSRVLLVIPAAMSVSLPPRFARLYGAEDYGGIRRLYSSSLRHMALFTAPATLVALLVGGPFLGIWAGTEYAQRGALPFQILVLGVAFSNLSLTPQNLLCSTRGASEVARYSAVEVVPYLLLTMLLTQRVGIVGAALAWSLRQAVSAGVMFALVRRVFRAPATSDKGSDAVSV